MDDLPVVARAARYITAAVVADGAGGLSQEPPRADPGAGLGHRLITRIFGPGAESGEARPALAELAVDPDGEDTRMELRHAIRRALGADPALRADVQMMIAGDYRQARDAGAADALADMADMMFHRGDADAARAVLQRAISSGGMGAVIALAEVLSWEGDMLPSKYARAGAGVAYKVAADAGSAEAMIDLGHMHMRRREIASAISWYQQAADTADPQWAPEATLQLAQIRRLIGDEK